MCVCACVCRRSTDVGCTGGTEPNARRRREGTEFGGGRPVIVLVVVDPDLAHKRATPVRLVLSKKRVAVNRTQRATLAQVCLLFLIFFFFLLLL